MLRSSLKVLPALVIAVALAPATAGAAGCPGADQPPTAATLRQAAAATLCLLNDRRAAVGLAPLAESGVLTALSTAYSTDMVARGYFEHVTPGGATLDQRLALYRYDWVRYGENIAWGQAELGTPAAIVRAWMDSPPHRHNILDGSFREIGLGIALGSPETPGSDGATYTTDFGTPPRRPHATAAAAARRVVRVGRLVLVPDVRRGHRRHHRRHHLR